MLLNTDYLLPTDVTGFARAALADLAVNQFTLSAFLPDRPIDDLEYRFVRGGEGLAEAATYRAFDAESPIAARPGITRVSGELPPISRKIRLGEYDRLRQRKLDTGITDALYTDTERMTRAVAARVELARGQALETGKVTIAENGVAAVIDFGRTAAHTNVAPANLWSEAATATPIADLLAWYQTYQATNNGLTPGAILTSRKVLNNILRTQEVRNLGAANGVSPSIISPATLATILEAYGLPPITLNDARVSVNGTATRLITDSSLILLPSAGDEQLGATLWGTTAESLEPDYGLAGAEPGIVAGIYKDPDPVALWTKAAGISVPILANPDLTFQAKVL